MIYFLIAVQKSVFVYFIEFYLLPLFLLFLSVLSLLTLWKDRPIFKFLIEIRRKLYSHNRCLCTYSKRHVLCPILLLSPSGGSWIFANWISEYWPFWDFFWLVFSRLIGKICLSLWRNFYYRIMSCLSLERAAKILLLMFVREYSAL